MSKNKLMRIEFPKVRKIIKKGNTYYEVDCRTVRWTGQKKFSFKHKRDALEMARKIANEVNQHGFDPINNFSQQLSDKHLSRWNDELGKHGKTTEDAFEFYINHLQQKSSKENSPLISDLCSQWSSSI